MPYTEVGTVINNAVPQECKRHNGNRLGACPHGIVSGASFGSIACSILTKENVK